MQITYLHQYFRTPAMSGGTRSFEFARRLVDRGHHVDMITADVDVRDDGRAWRVSEEAGINVHWAPVAYCNEMGNGERIRSFLEFAWLAARRTTSLQQDLVFASSTPLTIALPAMFASYRRKVPMVLEVRDLWPGVPIALGELSSPLRLAARILEAWSYKRSSHVVALSPDMQQSIKRRFPDVQTTVIPNAADVALFAEADDKGKRLRRMLPWLGERPLILYAGTLGLVNGVGYLVHVAAELLNRAPDVRIAIVGGGREQEAVARLAATKGVLNQNLYMVGPVPKAEVIGYFGACDIACSTVIDVPELAANSANKVFDAWAAGRPIAINHGGWIADVVKESGAGILLSPEDPSGSAARLAELLHDDTAMDKARMAAKQLAYDRFSRDRLFGMLEGVLASAARKEAVSSGPDHDARLRRV